MHFYTYLSQEDQDHRQLIVLAQERTFYKPKLFIYRVYINYENNECILCIILEIKEIFLIFNFKAL